MLTLLDSWGEVNLRFSKQGVKVSETTSGKLTSSWGTGDRYYDQGVVRGGESGLFDPDSAYYGVYV